MLAVKLVDPLTGKESSQEDYDAAQVKLQEHSERLALEEAARAEKRKAALAKVGAALSLSEEEISLIFG